MLTLKTTEKRLSKLAPIAASSCERKAGKMFLSN